eukprot:1093875-Pyramimonas_sp.AAC.1
MLRIWKEASKTIENSQRAITCMLLKAVMWTRRAIMWTLKAVVPWGVCLPAAAWAGSPWEGSSWRSGWRSKACCTRCGSRARAGCPG